MGGAFGINLGVVCLELRTRFHAEALTATQDYANSTARRLTSQVEHLLARSGLPETIQKSGALEYLGSIVQGQSLSLAFLDTFILGAIVAPAAVPPLFLLSRSHHRQGAATLPVVVLPVA